MKNREKKKHEYHGQTLVGHSDRLTLRKKRIIAIVSLVIAIALFVWLSVVLTKTIFSLEEGESLGDAAIRFKNMIQGYGTWGWIVAFGIQVLQVIVSPIPGEVVEIGMGLAFGWFWGAVLCLLGAGVAAFFIILFVRRFGVKFVELFVPVEKINELRFLNSEEKLERMVFILYLLPGTPKDPLIFFFGLTKIGALDFVIISSIARVPSVITSTIGGHLIHEKRYLAAVILFAVVGAISLVFVILYKKILEAMRRRHGEKKSEDTPAESAETAEESDQEMITNSDKDAESRNGEDRQG